MNYIVNNKGGRKLTLNGYMYTVKAITNTSTRWECSSRNSLRCKGLLRVDIDDPELVLSETAHNHLGSAVDVKVAEVKQHIKADLIQTAATGGSTQQVLCNNLARLSRDERRAFGNPQSAKRSFSRYIAQGRPVNPETLEDLTIEGPWSNDVDGNLFLIHDNLNNDNRIIVFGNEDCLRHLANSPTWYMDGTFKVAPALFQQLYVIRAALDESAISSVYAFMSSKHEESYIELFQVITDRCDNLGLVLDPLRIMIDFEKAMMNAIRNFFGGHVDIKGCFFHLCQNTWKKIQGLGLSQDYVDDDDVKTFCGMIDGLAFLPEDLVVAGMRYLSNNTPNGFDPLVEYFDRTYVSGTFRRIARPGRNVVIRNLPPLFPPAIWNVNGSTIADGARTNNLCEAWNNAFNKLVGYTNSTIWACIEGLQKDCMMSCLALDNHAVGIPLKKRVHQRTKDLQMRLKTLCTDHQNDDLDDNDFLRAIGHNIRFKIN